MLYDPEKHQNNGWRPPMFKTIFGIILICFPFLASSAEPIKIMTYNIRFDNSSIFTTDPNRWSKRKDPMADMIRGYDVDILGIQEGLSWQVDDLAKRLPDMNWYGIGRENGKSKGEFTAIFFKKNKFDVLDKGTFWLSETPEKVSIGWDANTYRIASWVVLKQRSSNKIFFVLNAHLDHVGTTARRESMKLILSKLKDLAKDLPVIVMGDFNTSATNAMTSQDYQPNKRLKDSRMMSINRPEGPYGTFISSGKFSTDMPIQGRIDFIFVNNQIEVLTYRVLTDSKNGSYFSDHLPVLIEAVIN